MTGIAATARALTREDWVRAALTAISHGGVRGVAVERLAKALGTTKGSFYWHFRDREDLVRAALEHWEEQETEGVTAGLEALPDPRERLRRLLVGIHRELSMHPDPSVALTGDTETTVREALERVTARRIRYVSDQLEALGVEPDEAARRAMLAYNGYLGHAALARSAPAVLPADAALDDDVETVLTTLTASTRRLRDDG